MRRKQRIEKGIIVSTRSPFKVGDSMVVSLPKRWLDIQTWLGRDVSELALVANEAIVLVPPDKEEKARMILERLERG